MKLPPKSLLLLPFALLTMFNCEYLIDFDPPEIEIISPNEGDSFLESLPCELEVTDNYGVEKIEVFVEDESVHLFTEEPYSVNISISSIFVRDYVTLKASAYDRAGNWSEKSVRIRLMGLEEISEPDRPSGPTWGIQNVSYTFSTGGGLSNFGHNLQYRFDWSDGTMSSWSSSTSASHTWILSAEDLIPGAGYFWIRAQARCATHNGVESDWSESLQITITAHG